MELTYHGQTTFKITGNKATVVLNPQKGQTPLSGDLIIANIPSEELVASSDDTKLFTWAGEYEANEVPIQGLDVKKQDGSLNTIFFFSVDGIRFCHLGNADLPLQKEELNTIGDVDILMLNIGEDSTAGVKNSIELIESIEPRVLIFMGKNYEQSLVLKELDLTNISKQDKFTLKSREDLPEEERKDIALNTV